MYYFVHLINILKDVFDRFPKIAEDSQKVATRAAPRPHDTNVSKHFPKISEDFRRLLKTSEEDSKMF